MKKLLIKSICLMLVAVSNISVAGNSSVELMKQFYKVADARPFDAKKLEVFFADKFVDYDSAEGHNVSGGEKIVNTFSELATGAPDSYHKIEFIEAVGQNKALVRWQYIGTHTGSLFGIPASGGKIDISGMELWEFTDGKVSGLWHVEELATLFQQISAK